MSSIGKRLAPARRLCNKLISASLGHRDHSVALSFVVIVYKMPEQARKTLYSLSTAYQQGVGADDYEVIVVENASTRPLGAAALEGLQGNFRYYYREETLPTPVPAINFGAAQARGAFIALMIDGARMASPGMVRHILLASRMSRNAVIAVPGYHLGDKVQQEAADSGYDEATENALLASINWPREGYRLFDIACQSATSRPGFFSPLGESNCLCVPQHLWRRIGGFDPRFTATGGGLSNLDFYKRVCDADDIELMLLPGEGTFHQFHGGVTTGGTTGEQRAQLMQNLFEEYKAIRGDYYTPPARRPMLFGTVGNEALRFMDSSVQYAKNRYGLEW